MQQQSSLRSEIRSLRRGNSNIHSSCEIDPNAYVGADVSIGAGTKVMANAYIAAGSRIGEGNIVFPNAVVGTQAQTRVSERAEGYVIIGDRNQIRENVTIHSGDEEQSTEVGSDNILMTNCHVAHHCVVGSRNVFGHMSGLAGHVHVGDQVTLGSFSGVKQFSRIGDGSYITPGSILHKSLPPYCVAQGVKAYLSCLNTHVIDQLDFSSQELLHLKSTLKIWRQDGLKGAVVFLSKCAKTKYANNFLKFLQQSEGLISAIPNRSGTAHRMCNPRVEA